MLKYFFLPMAAYGFYLFILSPDIRGISAFIAEAQAAKQYPTGSPMRLTFTGLTRVDKVVAFMASFFFELTEGKNRNSYIFCIYFLLAGVFPLPLIWDIESYRIGNKGKAPRYSFFWNIFIQLLGLCTVTPLYYYKHTTPASGGVAVPTHRAVALLPSLTIGYIIPLFLMLLPGFTPITRQGLIAFWQVFPIPTWLTHEVFVRTLTPPRSDLPALHRIYNICIVTSVVAHVYIVAQILCSPHPITMLTGVFMPGVNPKNITEAIFVIMQWDFILGVLGMLSWTAMCVWDLLPEKNMRSAAKLAGGIVLGSIVMSPGGITSVAMKWREDRLRSGEMAETKGKEL